MQMKDYILHFDLKAYRALDQYALLSCQKYNYGNDTDWFGSFRGGLYGSYARIHGITNHYYAVHSWIPRPRLPSETEYHIASLFFNMDSAVECITFALNAFGFCASNNQSFWDITDSKKLKRISPYDIIGRTNAISPKPPLDEYDKYFPKVKQYWENNIELLNTIFEQHDVSKHRETIFSGGRCRNDPPEGFFESLGIPEDDSSQKAIFWPMKEIIIKNNPKAPRVCRTPSPIKERVLLEDLVLEFKVFIEETGLKAIRDATDNIQLKVAEFEKA